MLLQIGMSIGQQVQMIHEMGYVHQRVTSGYIKLEQVNDVEHKWVLQDCGSSQKMGDMLPVPFDLGFAPEVNKHSLLKGVISADPKQDVFSMAFSIIEFVSKKPVFQWGQRKMDLDEVCPCTAMYRF